MTGRVLIVAGSDSGGGAGIQADLKTVTALQGYAATAITALTAQNTEGVSGIFDVDPDFVAAQMRAVLGDIGADCIKTGMLHRADVIETVCEVLAADAPDVPVVVDPVMVAKGGASLLEQAAQAALVATLLPRAAVLTPNLPEAEVLLGHGIPDTPSAEAAARQLLDLGPQAVVLKGGHLEGDTVTDVLATRDGRVEHFTGPRVATRSTHGTGCTLASAISCGLAQGMDLVPAVARARAYVVAALRAAPGLGRGHGPLGHGHTVVPFTADGAEA